MNPCKSHQRQIAMLSIQALSESESAAVKDHLRECDACRTYAQQLESIVGLYTQDANRPVAPSSATPRFEARRVSWLEWLFAAPRPAIAAAVALIICAAVLLSRPGRETSQPTQNTVAAPPQLLPAAPTIGNSRHLASADLDPLTAAPSAPRATHGNFVFSVRTRDEGL